MLVPPALPLTAGAINAALVTSPGLSVRDGRLEVVNSADTTKKLALALSGISAGTTRTLTIPNASGTLALLSLAQTWTAAQTFSSTLTVVDGNLQITGSSDATKIAQFEVDGFTTATTRTFTLPNANVVVAGSAAALTSGRVPFAAAGGLLTDSTSLTWSGASFFIGGNLQLSRSGDVTAELQTTNSGSPRTVTFTDTGGFKNNWLFGAQNNVDQAFEVTPSTTAGGSTYSSPSVVFHATSSAGETRMSLYDHDNGTWERVTVGAADSGGAGFKVLRIPN